MYVLQQLINGLSQGSIYALMAIGYTLIVGVVGLITFAYGEMVMIGAMSAYLFYTYVTPNFFLGLLVAFISSGIAGIFIHKVAYERFLDAPKSIALLCTVGCSLLIKNLAQIAFGSQGNAMPPAFETKPFYLFGTDLYITTIHMVVIAIVVVLAIGLSLFLYKTRVGLMLRAVSQDKMAASLVAINVKKVTLIGNIVGTGLGGIAGLGGTLTDCRAMVAPLWVPCSSAFWKTSASPCSPPATGISSASWWCSSHCRSAPRVCSCSTLPRASNGREANDL